MVQARSLYISMMASDDEPIPLLLWCPSCGARHVDTGEFAARAHHTHACQHCGMVWRPAFVPTCGVQFLPGFKDESPEIPIVAKGIEGVPYCCEPGCVPPPTLWQGRNDVDDYALWCAKHIPALAAGETRHHWPLGIPPRIFATGEYTSALSAGGVAAPPYSSRCCTARVVLP